MKKRKEAIAKNEGGNCKKEGGNCKKEGGNCKQEGCNEEKEGSRPPGSKNETLNPSQKTKGQEMHYVSWNVPAARRSLTAYVSFEVQALCSHSFFVLGKLVMQEGL